METLTLIELIRTFERAKEKGYRYVAVAIHIEEYEQPEIIINPYVNFDKKLEYYKNAYNDNGTLKANPNIRITMVACSNYIDKLNNSIIEYFNKIKLN